MVGIGWTKRNIIKRREEGKTKRVKLKGMDF